MSAPLRVFVSYATPDQSFADALVQALLQAGADVWCDAQDSSTDRVSDRSEIELAARPVFVLLLSPAAYASPKVQHETRRAYALYRAEPSRIILPVVAASIKPDSDSAAHLPLADFPRIEAADQHSSQQADVIARTLHLLMLAAPGTAPTSVVPEPEPAASAEDLIAQGKALAAQLQYAAALPYFERATQLAPRSFMAWFHLGFTRNHLDEWQGGYEAYERAVALDPNAAIAWNNLGNALHGLARYDEALAAYEHAVTLDPGFLTAWENKGDSLSALGRYREALAAYEHVLHLAPERLSALAGTAGMFSLLGEHDRALRVYARHEALAPLEVRSYITKGAELWSVRRYDEARVAFEAAVAAGGDTPLLWTNLGLALAKVKRSEEALAAFDRALALDPHYVDAAVQRARTLGRLRRFKELRAAVTYAADLRVEQRHARHRQADE